MIVEAELAREAATLLAPFLPRLVGTAGTEAIKATGEKVGEDAYDWAARLWDKLRPQLNKKPDVDKALREVAKAGEDPKEVEALISFNLKKIMNDLPPETIAEIRNIVDEAKTETRLTVASGDRSVAVGGDASRNVIITGDQSSAKPPE